MQSAAQKQNYARRWEEIENDLAKQKKKGERKRISSVTGEKEWRKSRRIKKEDEVGC